MEEKKHKIFKVFKFMIAFIFSGFFHLFFFLFINLVTSDLQKWIVSWCLHLTTNMPDCMRHTPSLDQESNGREQKKQVTT